MNPTSKLQPDENQSKNSSIFHYTTIITDQQKSICDHEDKNNPISSEIMRLQQFEELLRKDTVFNPCGIMTNNGSAIIPATQGCKHIEILKTHWNVEKKHSESNDQDGSWLCIFYNGNDKLYIYG